MKPPKVRVGLTGFLEKPPPSIDGARLGLLCNPASVDHLLRHARFLIDEALPGRLRALFSPQHGFFAEKQDNMIESDHLIDPVLKIPVFSLYGETRIPEPEMFDEIDCLLVDLQDAGTRVYTFIYTMAHCMEAAKKQGKKVLVLDRPNPINGIEVEGNCLKSEYASFVGRYPIPMRHGLTIGELALLFNDHFRIGCDLSVVPMKGWDRKMYYHDTGLFWVPPSPNLPTPVTAMVYPGQVLLEGTNLSEGRGTTQPFELFGAPFLDTEKILSFLGGREFAGGILRECLFEPTANKWKGRSCRGFQLHITDRDAFRPYSVTLALLRAVLKVHGDEMAWKPPPYEYEYEKLPIDLITGDPAIRDALCRLTIPEIVESFNSDIEAFRKLREDVDLY